MYEIDRESPQHVAKAIVHYLIGREFPITRICHFGSSIYLPEAKDIDILVSVQTPESGINYNYKFELDAIRARMAGNFEIPAPTDPYADESLTGIVTAIEAAVTLPVVRAFGPAPLLNKNSSLARVHLNGPVTDTFLELFGSIFPLHAWVIRNNCRCIFGQAPPAGVITDESVIQYVNIMRSRLSNSLSLNFLKKLIQTIGVITGETSCLPSKCFHHAFAITDPFRIAIEDAFRSGKVTKSTCEVCLDLLLLYARIMREHGIKYPSK